MPGITSTMKEEKDCIYNYVKNVHMDKDQKEMEKNGNSSCSRMLEL